MRWRKLSIPKGGLTQAGKLILRLRHEDGVSKRKLAKEFNVSRRTVRSYLAEPIVTYETSTPKSESLEVKKRRCEIENVLQDTDARGGTKEQ